MWNHVVRIMRCVWQTLKSGVLVSAAANLVAADVEFPQHKRGFQSMVIAHRGASGYLPEHTLAASSLAYGMRADYIEQDVVLSRDGQPVVLHDIHIDTVTNVAEKFPKRARADGRFYAIDFTLAELKTLYVHERTTADGKVVYPNRFPVGRSEFRIATLSEAIELIQGLNRSTGRNVGIYPELKQPAWHRQQGQDISVIVLDILAKYGYDSADDEIYLQCFEQDELLRIRNQLGCRLRMIQLTGGHDDPLLTTESLKKIATYAQGIGPSLNAVFQFERDAQRRTGLLERAHQAGLLVHAYTMRADALPQGIRDYGHLLGLVEQIKLDGVFTDFPDLHRQPAAKP